MFNVGCCCHHVYSELLEVDFGGPLHCLVICGTTHPLEEELLKWHRADQQQPVEGVRVASEAESGKEENPR